MEPVLCNAINKKLVDFIMRLPFPYIDIIREQIAACQITNEWYSDCYIMHFHHKNNATQLPLWLPTVPQGFHVLKENGPISCLLYVENGYIVQFDVIDMGLNEIDWEYLWSHKPIYDFEYDLSKICCYLTTERLRISKMEVGQHYVQLEVEAAEGGYTVCLWDCNISSLNLLHSVQNCYINFYVSQKDNHRYLVEFNNDPVLECSLVYIDKLRSHNTGDGSVVSG